MALSKGALGYPVIVSAGSTVAICTVPSTAGVAKTTYVRSIVIFNNTIGTANTDLAQSVQIYVVPGSSGAVGTATAGHRIARISLAANDTFFFEPQYPITLATTADSIQVFNEGTFNFGAATNPINVLALGDKEQ